MRLVLGYINPYNFESCFFEAHFNLSVILRALRLDLPSRVDNNPKTLRQSPHMRSLPSLSLLTVNPLCLGVLKIEMSQIFQLLVITPAHNATMYR